MMHVSGISQIRLTSEDEVTVKQSWRGRCTGISSALHLCINTDINIPVNSGSVAGRTLLDVPVQG